MAEFIFADDYRLDESSTRRFYEFFLKGLVHKHNNLMGVIQGFSSLILYDEDISDEVRENAQQMQDSAKIASELNRDVLVAGGCGRCDMESVAVADVLPYWSETANEICTAAGVSMQTNFSEGLPAISGDRGKLTEVFKQLVRNAADAASEIGGGSVAIDIFPPGQASPGNNVDLFIRNSSGEMSADDLRQAFEPFHSSKGANAFGLGLTIAAVLAGQMGMRLGLRHAEATTTAWLAMPPA
jgi:signal transduction histidine kinase